MVSTRIRTAGTLVDNSEWPLNMAQTVEMIFKLEACGFRVVKAEETLEYHGISKSGKDKVQPNG
jgi:hypothetical protein